MDVLRTGMNMSISRSHIMAKLHSTLLDYNEMLEIDT